MSELVSFSLAASAKQIRGSDSHTDQQWLARQLRHGILTGYKAGRQWRMTDQQIADAVEKLRPPVRTLPDIPVMAGLTPTSRRRMAEAS